MLNSPSSGLQIDAIWQYRRGRRCDASGPNAADTTGLPFACIAWIYIPGLEIALARKPNSANND